MNDFPNHIQLRLQEFRSYLTLRRERDPATADAYSRDASHYIKFYKERIDESLTSLAITPETFVQYSDYLKRSKLSKATIQRKLIGLGQFWKFLYKKQHTSHPPVSKDDLDIIIKTHRNPTPPLSPNQFNLLRRSAKDGLKEIY